MVKPNLPCHVLAPPIVAPPVVAPPVVAADQDAVVSESEEGPDCCREPFAGLRNLVASPALYITATCLFIVSVSISSLLNRGSDGLIAYAASSPSQTNLPEPPESVTARQGPTTQIAVPPAPLNARPIDSMIPGQSQDPLHQTKSEFVVSHLGRVSLATRKASDPKAIAAVATPIVGSDTWHKTESDGVVAAVKEPSITSVASITGVSDRNDDTREPTLTEDPVEFRLAPLEPGLPQWQWDAQRMVELETVETIASLPPTEPKCNDGQCPTSSLPTYGTTIQWAASPADASQRAEDEEKLVFMMHVSGNFKIPGFT